MMLSQLDLIIFDGLVEVIILGSPLFDIMDNLQQIDGDRKNLPTSLQNFLIFLILCLILFFELGLMLGFGGRVLHDRL